ncbi:MAG: hypothetical protein GX993_00580 [Bacteroidales bacterium]|nr:hypothetical protein [Bacteroidales bacterium]
MKRVLIYIGHPAQYHFLKNSICILEENGCDIKVLIKTKDILEQLLNEDEIEYTNIQPTPRGKAHFSILIASIKRTLAVIKEAKRFKADILVGTDSSVAQAAFILRRHSITVLEDDYDIIRNLARLTYPFTSCILVPVECKTGPYTRKRISYNGYMKLAYLHPNYFTPDGSVIRKYGLHKKYILIRLAQLSAHHDVNIKGLTYKSVEDIITLAENFDYRVYITSEAVIADGLSSYELKIRYNDIHHVLSHASILISDSQSMSMEAAMLGVPSLRFSDFAGRISVLEELEHSYGLTFGISTNNPTKLINKLEELLSISNLKDDFIFRRQKMLADKIDVTAFLTWFIDNYPESKKIMKKNPAYQSRFM